MNNSERREKIHELQEKLKPLKYDTTVASLRFNFLVNPYREPMTSQENQEASDLKIKIDELHASISPLFEQLRKLQIRYEVEYDGEVLSGGIAYTRPNTKVFFLSTDCNIDSYKNQPDYSNPEVLEVITEVREYIYLQEYSNFTIRHIRRL